MSPKTTPRCPYCQKPKPTQRAVNQHVFASKSCYAAWQDTLSKQYNVAPPLGPKRKTPPTMTTSESDGEDDINAGDHFEIPPDSPPASKRARVEEVEDE
ncbi:hypothetical protein H0H81_006037, partial [Sphagnurus paluster]